MNAAGKPICLTIRDSLKNLATLGEFASNLILNHLGQTVINLVHSSQFKIACRSDAISRSKSSVDGSQRAGKSSANSNMAELRSLPEPLNLTIMCAIYQSKVAKTSCHAISNVCLISRLAHVGVGHDEARLEAMKSADRVVRTRFHDLSLAWEFYRLNFKSKSRTT